MPLYEYECKKCHHRFERIQSYSARHMKKCPDCGGPVEQVITAPAVQFKGSGWYVNDYAKKPSQGASSSDGESSSKGSNAKEDTKEGGAKDASAKPAAKAEDKPKAEKKHAEKK